MSTIGNLYSKNIYVRLTNSKSEDRYRSIHITVDYQTTLQPTHKTELIIKLTDEQDPFFLYSLYMSEDDYQSLKVQQGLLVDFNAFGQRFIDLLFACEKDEKSENPKFQLQFYSKEPLPYDHGHASLNIIEINPFKHLCHLSLNFTPGNDTDVKKYLANCLQTMREEYSKLLRLYEETKLSLSQKLDGTQQTLSQKSCELEKLKLDLEAQAERMLTKHMQELNFERDKSMQNHYAAQQKWDKDKKDMELNHMKTVKQMESRVNELELVNKDLLEKKYKNESQLQELRAKNANLQEDYGTVKQELLNVRKQNSSMDSELHTSEKQLNQLRTRIAVLEQEMKDKLDLVEKTQDLFGNEQNQRKQLEEGLREKSSELKKKQAEINHYVQEFKKGNEVVVKLQTREKSLVGQLKLKTRILNEQEKVMKEKEKEIDDLKGEIKELRAQIGSLSDEGKDLKNSLQKKSAELEEAAKLLKRDENKNNLASNGKMVTYGNSDMSFKPMGALTTSNYNTGNMSSASTASMTQGIDSMHGMMGRNATSNGLLGSQFTNKNEIDSNTRRVLLSSNSQMPIYSNGNYQQLQQQQRTLSSSSNSSLPKADTNQDPIEIESPTLMHRTLTGTVTNGSTRLDPKYFQSHPTITTTNLDKPGILSNRINKPSVQSSTAQNHQQASPNQYAPKPTPPLASAYFPSN